MISHISIKDFAIVENAEIDFQQGLNIITGETGAGKSIVIEAVSLALGARADTAFVRSGKDKAVVQLVGDLDGDEVVITRQVSATGKNICKLNGEIVTLGQLNQACKRLADIHGQYDHQSLLNPEYHITLVDLYGHSTIESLRNSVRELYFRFKERKDKLNALLACENETKRKQDFMAFELAEIQKASLTIGEDDILSNDILLAQNREKIYELFSEAQQLMFVSDVAAINSLYKSMRLIEEVSEFSPNIKQLHSEISDIYYRLEDTAHELRGIKDSISFSRQELDAAIDRIELIKTLTRKYGNMPSLSSDCAPNSIKAVLAYGDYLKEQLSYIESYDETKTQFTALLAVAEEELFIASKALSEERKEVASRLSQEILAQLSDLNFEHTQLTIEFEEFIDSQGAYIYTENGIDIAEFLISTNKGEPLKPLSKIASGGEMSRIMLAFKSIIADYDAIPTMIFDEIDSGISGITASIVGKKLLHISQKHQIICITHLPQIAACGTSNYKIDKASDDASTRTTITKLEQSEKIQEIARLLGGLNITETTISSAEELIAASHI